MPLDPAQGYPETNPAPAKFAGNANAQAMQFVLDIDAAMRANYATNIVNIGNVIYPILYAESTFDGGRYTLLVDEHTSWSTQNVSPIYDQAKAVAHIPLGIFSIVSGYFDYPNNAQWVPALQTYCDKVQLVRNTLAELNITDGNVSSSCLIILANSISYMKSRISNPETLTMDGFEHYARNLNSFIGRLQTAAAADQIKIMSETLADWKSKLGPTQWNKLYVVVSAIWTLSVESAHELIIKSFMEPDKRETNVIVSEAVGTLELARTLLGRIVGDRIMAAAVFDKTRSVDYAEDIYSLSTQRDLLSQAIEKQLPSAKRETATCPHLVN